MYSMARTSQPASGPASSAGDPEIRHVRTPDEFAACVDLQGETWGWSFSEVVPVSMLRITAKMGGICMGAFDPGGTLLGFVYGMTGLNKGELAHWSHMLAVRPGARDRGIGRRLKVAQKEALRAAGVDTMYWTYDPLVARNAHLNLNILGVTVDEYVPDMYGESDSLLHQLGTDRFIVKWDLRGGGGAGSGGRDGVGMAPGADDEVAWRGAEVVEVLIPNDIEAVEARSADEALEWRLATRRAFTQLLGRGGRVAAFVPGRAHGRYVVKGMRGDERDA